MSALRNSIKRVAGGMDDQRGVARHAIVTSVNSANGTVKVSWDESGTQSGWLPVVQPGAGNGWSVVCLPVVGTQVFTVPDMGDMSHAVVVGSVQSTQQPPGQIKPYGSTTPQNIVPGEITLIHSSGASLRLTAGAIEVVGTLRVTGDILVSGEISDLNAARGTLDLLRNDHNKHTHVAPDGVTTIPNLVTP